MVVDVHAHVGMHNKMPWLGTNDAGVVLDRARRAGVDISVLSHLDGLYRRPADTQLLRALEKRKDALMWWVVDPRSKSSIRNFRSVAGHPKVLGMKIGPTYHKYPFVDHAQTLLELARELDVAILTHSGEPNDMPSDIVPWVNRYPDVRFVIAHYGNCLDFKGHLKALLKCTSPNCFVDTSSSVSVVCDHIESGVSRLGVGRFLFGTDSPLYSVAAQCARILEADLTPREKRAILGENAMRKLLRLKSE